MIQLSFTTEPQWLDITPAGWRAGQVWVQVLPLDTVSYQTALAAARQDADQAAGAHRLLAEAGATVDGPDLTDPLVLQAYTEAAFARELARRGIVAWEGVGDETGQPLPCEREWIERLMMSMPQVAERFVTEYVRPHVLAGQEGNASGASSNGISTAAPDTAPDAPNAAPPAPTAHPAAPASAAPMSSTG